MYALGRRFHSHDEMPIQRAAPEQGSEPAAAERGGAPAASRDVAVEAWDSDRALAWWIEHASHLEDEDTDDTIECRTIAIDGAHRSTAEQKLDSLAGRR